MMTATSLFADGLDLVAEFLARSRPDGPGMAAGYSNMMECRAASRALAAWMSGLAGQGALVLDESQLQIRMPMALWQELYGRALVTGFPVEPDRIGLATRGAGGMLATLSLLLEFAEPVLQRPPVAWHRHAAFSGRADMPAWKTLLGKATLVVEWQPLRDLLRRDGLLLPLAMQPRPMLDAAPLEPDRSSLGQGFLLAQDGQPQWLVCDARWYRKTMNALRQHFFEHVLLLFRLMFPERGQGWGMDPASRLCAGLAELMARSGEIGLKDFRTFGGACAALACAVEQASHPNPQRLLNRALKELAQAWPAGYLGPGAAATPLFTGWMAWLHPLAQVAPHAVLEPDVRIGARCVVEEGAVIRAGACLGEDIRVPAGVIIAAGAKVGLLRLSGVSLPRGTVLEGDLALHPGAWIRRQVVLGAEVEIGPDVTIPEGVQVLAGAVVRKLALGTGVQLPPGTQIAGDLVIEDHAGVGSRVRFGAGVLVGAHADIGDGVVLPAGAQVAPAAGIDRLDIHPSAELAPGLRLHGNLAVAGHAMVGAGAVLGRDVAIGPHVLLPDGVVVANGARIDVLQLHGAALPAGTWLAGNLRLGADCSVGRGVRFGADVLVGDGIDIPDGAVIAPGARIRALETGGCMLPAGTLIRGSLRLGRGVQLGQGIDFGADACVKAGVSLPEQVALADGARICSLRVPPGAMPFGARLHGDLLLHEGVRVGRGVEFQPGVQVLCPCAIPDGVVLLARARVNRLSIAAGVALPPGTAIAGDLQLGPGVTVGAGVIFGAHAWIAAGVAVPPGARLCHGARASRIELAPDVVLPTRFLLGGDVRIGRAAVIGRNAFLGAGAVIGPEVVIPAGLQLNADARVTRMQVSPLARLPASVRVMGNLVIRRKAVIGEGVLLGADVEIGPYVTVPAAVIVAAGARIRFLEAPPDSLPPGTLIGGSLKLGRGARIGRQVSIGADARIGRDAVIGSHVSLPAGCIVLPGADIRYLSVAPGVCLPPGSRLGGSLRLARGVVIGRHVQFGDRVWIGHEVAIPDRAVLPDGAHVGKLRIAADAVIGDGLVLHGDAEIASGARLGQGVALGRGVLIGAGVVIEDNVAVGQGAVIGAQALLEDGAVVPAGERIPAGARIAPQRAVPASMPEPELPMPASMPLLIAQGSAVPAPLLPPPPPQETAAVAAEADRPQDLAAPVPISLVRGIARPGRPFSFN